jgi:hypothetical protein
MDQSGEGSSEDSDAIDESDAVQPSEAPVLSEHATERGQWNISRSRNIDQVTQSIIGIGLVTLVGIVVLVGAIIFWRDPNIDLRPYTAQLLTPIAGLAGIAVGYFFGRRH